MFNRSGITTVSAVSSKQILADVKNFFSVGCIVDKTDGVLVDGRKIMKAGTPVVIDLTNLQTPVVSETTAEGASDANAILLHDVDVTDADANGAALLFGFVNFNRLDASVQTLMTAEVQAALSDIKFISL